MSSRTPFSASRFTSSTIFSTGRETSAPRVYGTTQKVQNLSQPSCTVTKAEMPRARIASDFGCGRKPNLSWSGNSVSIALLSARCAFEQLRQMMIALRADHDVDHGRAADDLLAFGLRDAAGDRDLHVATLRAASSRATRSRPSSE